MTSKNARQSILQAVGDAHDAGLTYSVIALETEISERTLQRWREPEAKLEDQRRHCERPSPTNALKPEEKEEILTLCKSKEYASMPPAQIVTDLADKGRYLASESTFYRVLREAKQQHHRGRARAPARKAKPARHTATAPGQVWVWDITWLPSIVTGHFFKLYMIMDLFSRTIVAQEVHPTENAEFSEALLRRALLSEGHGSSTETLVVHGDNGSPFKAYSLKACMEKLGIKPSHSRPRVSNDNAHAEALFRTVKYHPSCPPNGFKDLDEARQWALSLTRWYNETHRHSAIGWVTPIQKHRGQDIEILRKRRALYEQARAKNPCRWIQAKCRAWAPVSATNLNPIDIRKHERDLKRSA